MTDQLIIIPGLGNDIKLISKTTESWKKFGIISHIFDTRWKIEERGFSEKLRRALALVDSISNSNTRISLLGNSAGSSFALNILGERKDKISRVVVNCGRVREGDFPWFTFDQATAYSPSFKESVLYAQELEKKFTSEDRGKIMTYPAASCEVSG